MTATPTLTVEGEKRMLGFAESMASDFETVVLNAKVECAIQHDKELAAHVDAAARAEEAARRRKVNLPDDDDHRVREAEEAWGYLAETSRERAREVVAHTCAEVLDDLDEDSGYHDRQAAEEAAEWLRTYTNVSARLGLIPDRDETPETTTD